MVLEPSTLEGLAAPGGPFAGEPAFAQLRESLKSARSQLTTGCSHCARSAAQKAESQAFRAVKQALAAAPAPLKERLRAHLRADVLQVQFADGKRTYVITL